MVVTPVTAEDTATAILALGKSAWKLGVSLSKLDQDAGIVDITVKNLAGEVKSFGIECDLVYSELQEVVSKAGAGPPPRYEIYDEIWSCLITLVEEADQTIQEVELFCNGVSGEGSGSIGQARRQRKLEKNRDNITSVKENICRHTDSLRITLLLIKTKLRNPESSRADRRLSQALEKLQYMLKKLQTSFEASPQSRPSQIEARLMQYAREVIIEGTTTNETRSAAKSIAGSQGATSDSIGIAEWPHNQGSAHQSQQRWNPQDMEAKTHSMYPAQRTVEECEAVGELGDSDDDLDTDLATAALDTGTVAFEAREWEDANSLLQEALRVLQQLPTERRAFCDIFSLHYKLAVCAYHTQGPVDAEEALLSLVQQPASSDIHRGCIYDAKHLLSQIYLRIGQVERARSECEKALQARRRLLGKQSDASLESTVLMAHIYFLLNNRARAKSCLAMIPEARREEVIKTVERSMGTTLGHLEFSTLLNRETSEDLDRGSTRNESRRSSSTFGQPVENFFHSPVPSIIKSPANSPRQPPQDIFLDKSGVEGRQVTTAKSHLSVEEVSEWRSTKKERPSEDHSADPVAFGEMGLSQSEVSKGQSLSRKEILDKVGCQPRDRIETAVCDGDHAALASLLSKKKDSWRSKFRKRVRSERVTALHFAALFGEMNMARRLLDSGFNINEVPYGYTTSLTPLTFAVGARRVDMVRFLVANGAKPSELDSWSTLAGQLMSRSWLMKTMSDSEKELVPTQIVAIFGILLQHGWDVNMPFETTGRTVLHQAVTFWTGSYKWDLNLRAVITSFLCERGANPFQRNTEGKTPYDIASASGHHDLLLVLDRHGKRKDFNDGRVEPAELAS
ncbi:uncharacterized protein K460DRAFT_338998 [Cucurbitaria berberidis CBS 394.84]|uniref:Ankyrin n=1 Tax=Cucurbitaria berberidis CBS 394.84 TaxID=1168544 RepID=A0A9P4GH86_9PLEO|nr:uncharacterized protein K460DRAFT_338998 [Cucurbitaria berberidis CBS 394.84]KAF1846093.1 hypothetical protein K460DRAFT_338998 [Cucurbitaria berberidis CBS 394.84]